MKRPEAIFSNCFLCLLYLLIRGRVVKVAVISPQRGRWMPHLAALNAHGDALHFHHVLPDEENPHAPWWFLGRIEGISRERIHMILAVAKRHVMFVMPARTATTLAVLVWLLCSIPWIYRWGFGSIGFNYRGALEAWRKRR